MDLSLFDSMDSADLKNYIRFLLWHYRVVDAFWFISVSDAFDQSTAEKLNENVWGRVSGMAAKDIISRFKITEKGLDGFFRVLEYFPWSIMGEFNIQKTEKEALISFPYCPPQVSRLERGLGEYVCKEMHKRSYEGIARAVDPRIRVECLFAPPDPHPKDVFCKWRIYMEKK